LFQFPFNGGEPVRTALFATTVFNFLKNRAESKIFSSSRETDAMSLHRPMQHGLNNLHMRWKNAKIAYFLAKNRFPIFIFMVAKMVFTLLVEAVGRRPNLKADNLLTPRNNPQDTFAVCANLDICLFSCHYDAHFGRR
jgi:hypothetical protein